MQALCLLEEISCLSHNWPVASVALQPLPVLFARGPEDVGFQFVSLSVASLIFRGPSSSFQLVPNSRYVSLKLLSPIITGGSASILWGQSTSDLNGKSAYFRTYVHYGPTC